MIRLPDWTEADQARHRAELTDALATLETRGRYPRQPREHQPTPWSAATTAPSSAPGHAVGATLEELLAAW